MIKSHTNKNLIMSAEEEKRFQSSNSCWICDKLFDVGDNVTRKYRGAAHWSCNINLGLSKKIPVMFHNLRGYDSHLIIKEINKFDVKVSVIPNGLENCVTFTINRNLVFINSMQFMNSSLDSLVKNLSDSDFKYLSGEFSGEVLGLVKQKGVYSDEYMDSFKKFCENKPPARCNCFSSLKDGVLGKNTISKSTTFGMCLK